MATNCYNKTDKVNESFLLQGNSADSTNEISKDHAVETDEQYSIEINGVQYYTKGRVKIILHRSTLNTKEIVALGIRTFCYISNSKRSSRLLLLKKDVDQLTIRKNKQSSGVTTVQQESETSGEEISKESLTDVVTQESETSKNITKTPLFDALREQILNFEGAAERLTFLVAIEKLLLRISPNKSYEIGSIEAAVFGNINEGTTAHSAAGSEIRVQLLGLIQTISEVTDIPVEVANETVSTVEEVAQRWNVSLKTVSRWRERGLTAHTFLFGNKTRVGFLESSLKRFENEYPDIIRYGNRFKRITEEESESILRRADKMFENGMLISKVITTIAQDMQRSLETIRQILKNTKKSDVTSTNEKMSERAAQCMCSEYRNGKSLEQLAQRYGIDAQTAARVVNRSRAQRIFELPLDYMESPEFKKRSADAQILAATPESPRGQRLPRKPSDLPAYIASLYDVPLLTAEQETHLFRKYNYLKYKVTKLREELDPARPKAKLLDEIESLYKDATETKNLLIRSNLRLVVAVAKKYIGSTGDLFDKVSEGNLSLMRAIEKFDYTRGFKFSTYATWAIKKNYIRSYSNEFKQTDRFRTGQEELLDASPSHRIDPTSQLIAQRQREDQVSGIMERLTDRERQIICARFGIGSKREPMTLKDVGIELGVSKERVRQIESRAMQKLREAALNENIQIDELFDEEKVA